MAQAALEATVIAKFGFDLLDASPSQPPPLPSTEALLSALTDCGATDNAPALAGKVHSWLISTYVTTL